MSSWTRKAGVLLGILLIAAAFAGGTDEVNDFTGTSSDLQDGGTYIDATGTVELTCETRGRRCEGAIDFDEAQPGSELWHLREKASFGRDWRLLKVKLTSSFFGEAVYEKRPEVNTVVIYGEKAGEVSYQLVAPKQDQLGSPKVT